ncbi:MAG: tRNA lysidine(34) synthetase TilS [SAR202 cluster bacterium]|nr:tRNA lysidine(34) synthetase TilS [SAR202 cluster bacterium]
MRNMGPATRRASNAVGSFLRLHAARLGGRPIVLAVSGGADSLALLAAFGALAPKRRPPLVVAHFSHGLRPAAAEREARIVARAAAAFDAPFMRGHAKAAGVRQAEAEAPARAARYAFLAEVARAHDAVGVATGHTLDDQAETVLLRLARGSGLRGAAAMRPWSTIDTPAGPVTILRSLLGLSRADTEAVCAEAGLRFARDPTNRSVRFARNRIRHRVLPELSRVNPRAAEALARFAEDAREDDALLRDLAMARVAPFEERTDGAVSWRDRARLRSIDRPLLARALESAWAHVRGRGATLTHAQVEAMRRLIASSEGGTLRLPGGMRFAAERDTCRLGRERAAPTPREERLRVPGATRFGPWRVEASVVPPGEAPEPSASVAVLDAEVAERGLAVRSRRPGDRYAPLGMPGPVKLQDLLVNAKVPRAERDLLPLVCGEHGIAWVPGLRVAEWARVVPATASVLVLEASRASEA